MTVDYDSFTRTNSTALGSTPGGRAWIQAVASHDIFNNELRHDITGGDSIALIDVESTEQNVQSVLGQVDNAGLVARSNSTGSTAYLAFQYGTQSVLLRKVNGSFTQLGVIQGNIASGDRFEIDASDTVISMLRNGVVLETEEDSNITTGDYCGVSSGPVLGISYTDFRAEFDTIASIPVAPEGVKWVKFSTTGSGAQFSRLVENLSPAWGEGLEYIDEFYLYLPTGFHAALTAPFQFYGHDKSGLLNYHSRLMISHTDDLARMFIKIASADSDLTGTFGPLPEDTIMVIKVWQKLSTGSDGFTRIYKDDVLVASGTGPNLYTATGIDRLRHGIVATGDASQTNPLDIYMDHIRLTVLSGIADYVPAPVTVDRDDWHTSVLEWSPDLIRLYLDGSLIGEETDDVPTSPHWFVIQTDTDTDGTVPLSSVEADVNVDWAVIWQYAPPDSGVVPEFPFTDTFDTNLNKWNVTEIGSGTTVDVVDGEARVLTGSVLDAHGILVAEPGMVPVSDVDIRGTFRHSQTGVPLYTEVWGRAVPGVSGGMVDGTGYGLQTRDTDVALIRRVNGTDEVLGTVTWTQTTVRQHYWLHLHGTDQDLKVWTEGVDEPATWGASGSNSAITSAGVVSLHSSNGWSDSAIATYFGIIEVTASSHIPDTPPTGGEEGDVPPLSSVGPRVSRTSHPGGNLTPGTYTAKTFATQVTLSIPGHYIFVDCDASFSTLNPQRTGNVTYCNVNNGMWFEDPSNPGGHAGWYVAWSKIQGGGLQAMRPKGTGTITVEDTWMFTAGTDLTNPELHTETLQLFNLSDIIANRVAFSCQPRWRGDGSTPITAVFSSGQDYTGDGSIISDCIFGYWNGSAWEQGGGFYAIYPGRCTFIRPIIYCSGTPAAAFAYQPLPGRLVDPTYN